MYIDTSQLGNTLQSEKSPKVFNFCFPLKRGVPGYRAPPKKKNNNKKVCDSRRGGATKRSGRIEVLPHFSGPEWPSHGTIGKNKKCDDPSCFHPTNGLLNLICSKYVFSPDSPELLQTPNSPPSVPATAQGALTLGLPGRC